MGLYQELQNDLTEAFNTDLSDAVKSFLFTENATSTYDPITGTNSTTETSTPIRGIPLDHNTGEIVDKPTRTDALEILVLDVDATITFNLDQKITFENQDFILKGITPDPAKASWTLFARRLG